MDYSFYGGRRGAAFVITRRFRYISADKITQRDMKLIKEEYGDNKPIKTLAAWKLIYCMKEAFSQGGNYTVVNYDEYVIIDSFNKNDSDNGKIFRRGYSYTDELGGAQYVGQIVGPSGLAPAVEMTTYDKVVNMTEQEGYEYRHTDGKYAPTVNLVPGKKDDGTFNDNIKWACCSVRDEFNKDTTAYVGFTFPYTVIEYTAATVDPYYHRSNNTANFVNQNLIDRADDGQHPFFEKWDIKIPKGIKGDAFKNFRVINAAASDNVQPYSGQAEDRAADRAIFVYDYYHYDKDGNGEPVTIYLGDCNVIDNVTVNDEGTFTINYSHDDDSVWTKKFKWIKNVSLNTDNGTFTVVYNHTTDENGNPTTYTTSLDWVKNISFDEEGTVTFDYTHSPDKVNTKLIKWVKDISLNTSSGHMVINYNHATDKDGNSTKYETDLDWVKDISVAADGTVTFDYTYSDDKVLDKLIKWITHVDMSANGQITITYNDGTTHDVNNKLRWISSMSVDMGENEGDGTQKLMVTYNDGTVVPVSSPINYIIKSVITPNDYHLLILYSDPIKRQEIKDAGKNREFDGRDDWYDLGSVRADNGILVGMHYDIDETPVMGDIHTAIEFLNNEWPSGLIGDNLVGKCVTSGSGIENKYFFGFNYDTGTDTSGGFRGWYCIGTFGDLCVIAGRDDDITTQLMAQTLPTGGIWMVTYAD